MSWPGAILTDSGGFQVFSLSGLRRISEDGVVFQSHLNGDPHKFTPESTVDVQLAFGSDIAMVLDECPPYPVSHEFAREAMERTVRWARRGDGPFPARALPEMPTRHALFPIVQGSMFADLRRRCATELVDLDADGYAVGGLSVGEPRPLSLEMAEATRDILPRGPAALRHGSRDAGRTAGVRGPRHRYDGLRAAFAQRPQRLALYQPRGG